MKFGRRLEQELLAWEGVEAKPHRFGGRAFYVGRREIGHIHGDRWVDIPFPRNLKQALKEEGKVETHPHAPKSGWSRITLASEHDYRTALNLMRRSYDRDYDR